MHKLCVLAPYVLLIFNFFKFKLFFNQMSLDVFHFCNCFSISWLYSCIFFFEYFKFCLLLRSLLFAFIEIIFEMFYICHAFKSLLDLFSVSESGCLLGLHKGYLLFNLDSLSLDLGVGHLEFTFDFKVFFTLCFLHLQIFVWFSHVINLWKLDFCLIDGLQAKVLLLNTLLVFNFDPLQK